MYDFNLKKNLIQGLIDVHPSFQDSTLESFVSHGSGAPGLDIVVDKYHDMVGKLYQYVFYNSCKY